MWVSSSFSPSVGLYVGEVLLKLSSLNFCLQFTPLTAVTEAAEKQKPIPKVIKSLTELRQGGKDSLALKIIREVSGLSGDVANWQAILLALANLVRSQSGQDVVTEGNNIFWIADT